MADVFLACAESFANEFPQIFCCEWNGVLHFSYRLGLQRARPKKGDEVKVHYVGTLTDGSEPEHVAETADTADTEDMDKFLACVCFVALVRPTLL